MPRAPTISLLGLAALVSLWACANRSERVVDYDASKVVDSGISALLAVIRDSGDGTPELLHASDFGKAGALTLSGVRVPNDPAAQIVMLTYAEGLEGVRPTFVPPNASPQGLAAVTPVGIFHAPLEGASRLAPLDPANPAAPLIESFARTIHVDPSLLPPPAAPKAPGNLVASASGPTEIRLAWQDNSDNETGFSLEYCSGSGCSEFRLLSTTAANVTSHAHAGLSPATAYSYRAKAVHASGESAYSNVATAATAFSEAPRLTAYGSGGSPGQAPKIRLAWSAVEGAAGYKVARSAAADAACTGASFTTFVSMGASTEYDDSVGSVFGSAPAADTWYCYAARASGAQGDSPASAPEEAIVPLQPAISGYSYNGTSATIRWSSTSSKSSNYRVFRAEGSCASTAPFVEVSGPGVAQARYADAGVNPGRAYCYQIQARRTDPAPLSNDDNSNRSAAYEVSTLSQPHWVYEAEWPPMSHSLGRAEPDGAPDGWAAAVASDQPGNMVWGPYTTEIPAGTFKVLFRLMVDNNVGSEVVARVNVNDFDGSAPTCGHCLLAERELKRSDFARPFAYQDFELTFVNPGGHRLEFRTYWTGVSYVRQDRITVRP